MSVSVAQRRQAIRKSRDVAQIQRLGVIQAKRVSYWIMRAVLRAYRRGADPIAAACLESQKLLDPLAKAWLAAFLKGLWRSRLTTGVQIEAAARFDLLDDAVGSLERRLALTDAQYTALFQQGRGQTMYSVAAFDVGLEKKLTRTMATITQENLHVAGGLAKLHESFDALGISPKNSFQIEAIFRTQTQMAYSSAQWNANQSPIIQEMLWGYTYVTVGDDRVRDEHAGLDGVALPKDDPKWQEIWPPNGYACRCSVIEEFDEPEDGIVHVPEAVTIDGKTAIPGPDRGFAFNPGTMNAEVSSILNIKAPAAEVVKRVPAVSKAVLGDDMSQAQFQRATRKAVREAKLKAGEKAAVQGWTGGNYGAMRAVQMGQTAGIDKYALSRARQLVPVLEKTFAKLPEFEGTIYRGIALRGKMAADVGKMFRVGGSLDSPAFASWTRSRKIGESFTEVYVKGKRVQGDISVILKCPNGKGAAIETISMKSIEQEILVKQGTKTVVTAVKDVGLVRGTRTFEIMVERIPA